MKRVRFVGKSASLFIEEVQKSTGLSLARLSEVCDVSRSSLSDWKRGRYLMPLHVFKKLSKKINIDFPDVKIVDEYWHVKKAAKKGGKATYEKYGQIPGWTKEASAKGGRKAIKKLIEDDSFPYVQRKPVDLPEKSCDLAEFFGIMLGDGGMSNRQVTITLHKDDDREYVKHVKNLIEELFKVTPSLITRKNVTNIVISRTSLVEYLCELGLVVGSKVKQQACVPQWITRNKDFVPRCLRGLFDTDGSFYVDIHKIKNKKYKNPGMSFSNRSKPLLNFFKEELEKIGMNPTKSSKFAIFLRRKEDIMTYYDLIGFSNLKHKKKFDNFFVERGRVG